MDRTLSDDQRKHLDLVQSTISRMAGSSASIKGWTATVAVAAYGLSRAVMLPELAVLGLVVVLLMAVQDARYLSMERRYRHLFDDIVAERATPYSMDVRTLPTGGRVLLSWSITGFYGVMLGVGVVAMVVAFAHPPKS